MRRNARKRSQGRFVDRKNGIIDPWDNISRLPDHILHHMISFLPSSAKEQVRSLSINWRQLNKETQRALSMIGHRLDEQELSRILVDFPSVEFLSLKKCSGMRTLRLEKLKLKNIELKYCVSLKNLQLDTPNVEAFLFHGPRLRPCTIEFGICKKLKVVHLVGVAMNKAMFTDCNKNFSLLQQLVIGGCDFTGCIKISSNSLERLSLLRFNTSVAIHIKAPNLRSFVYNGSTIPSLIMHSTHLILAELDLRPYQERDEKWVPKFLQMLRRLKHAQKLRFHSKFDENIIVPKELRETLNPPIDGMPFIEIKTNSRSNNIVHLTDAMLWLCPRGI
uniref:F-box/LRR-repeat protein At3g03360-like n=1 Tax=Erigeron canadensis TaxID=72917 RepID=UPI001CB9341C|nr:F-box/LRR-repeat protein At3g03360-like [Erigeron canadensis]